MHFTQEDYRKIEDWLYQRTVKDTELPCADPMDGTEKVPILQDNKNKTIRLNDFVKQVADMKLPDFYNVTVNSKKPYLSLEEAVSSVPVKQRKLGLTITYHNENGNWMVYQFKGDSINQWSSLNYWSSIVQEAIEDLLVYPDDEDVIGIRDGNRTFIKFRDKDYDPEDFSGMGRIMLRKNLVATEACSLDDEDHFTNILTQDMIREENTVYTVQYDYDLDGRAISIPKGCTLWFQGGSINNGTVYLQDTAILGAFEFADVGDVKLFGKFNTGQVMTFSDDSYKAKTGGYFTAGTKNSSATVKEDANNDKETFYDKNSSAYTTKKRQELRWWNGEEWLLILDITDYNEIKSIINDLIDKHNAEMSACYKYFKTRCYALEQRMDSAESRLDDAESRLDNAEGRLDTVESRLDTHDETLEAHQDTLDKHEERITNNEKNIDSNARNIRSNEGAIAHNAKDITDLQDRADAVESDIKNIKGDIEDLTETIGPIDEYIPEVKETITEINSTISDLNDVIKNLNTTIENHIVEYVTNNIIGTTSITVNSVKYEMDEEGNITLPDYPKPFEKAAELKFTGIVDKTYDGSKAIEVNIPAYDPDGGVADSVKGTLTVKDSEGNPVGTYDGSSDVTIDLPETGGDTIITANETLTIKQGDTTLGTFNGTEPKTINIPEFPDAVSTATKVSKKLKFTGAVSAQYDGSEEVTVNIPTASGSVVDSYNPNGTVTTPVILCATELAKSPTNTWGALDPMKNEHIESLSCNLDGGLLKVSLNTPVGWRIDRAYAVANAKNLSGTSYNTTVGSESKSIGPSGIQCGFENSVVYLHAWEIQSSGTITANGLGTSGHYTSLNLLVVGYIEERPVRTITVTVMEGVNSVSVYKNDSKVKDFTANGSFEATDGDKISWTTNVNEAYQSHTTTSDYEKLEYAFFVSKNVTISPKVAIKTHTVTVTVKPGVKSITVHKSETNVVTYTSSSSFTWPHGGVITWSAEAEDNYTMSTSSGSITVTEDKVIAPTATPSTPPQPSGNQYFEITTTKDSNVVVLPNRQYPSNTSLQPLSRYGTAVDGQYIHRLTWPTSSNTVTLSDGTEVPVGTSGHFFYVGGEFIGTYQITPAAIAT